MDFYIKNKIIQLDKKSLIKEEKKLVSHNTGYIANFIFDEEWDGKEKTARFISGDKYKDVLLIDDKCEIPIDTMGSIVEVGVFAGNLKSTTATYVRFLPDILMKYGLPADPTPEIYAQILERIENIREEAVTEEEIQEAVDNYLRENPVQPTTITYKSWTSVDIEEAE